MTESPPKKSTARFSGLLADGKYLQFRVEGSMTGMNLIEGNVTLRFQAYKLVRISVHLRTAAVLGFGAAFGLDAAK
ncbi:MAG: hypothetical protein ACLTSK_00150 [Christensenellales bacterium]